jgi:hypothetical protein
VISTTTTAFSLTDDREDGRGFEGRKVNPSPHCHTHLTAEAELTVRSRYQNDELITLDIEDTDTTDHPITN